MKLGRWSRQAGRSESLSPIREIIGVKYLLSGDDSDAASKSQDLLSLEEFTRSSDRLTENSG